MLMPQGTIYLSGARTPLLDAQVRFANHHANTAYEAPPIGILLTPKTPDRPDDFTPEVANIYQFVGLDNGCFTASGQARFRALGVDGYIRLGLRAVELWGDGMLFVTAPDVPMDWAGTLRASMPVISKIRKALPARAALVLQDGATPTNVPWHEIDWVFIGGSTEWKIGRDAKACALEARRRGKGVHMGRVNSLERMRVAQQFRCDSADGTYLLHEDRKGAGAKAVETIFGWARDSWATAARAGGDPYDPASWDRKRARVGRSSGVVISVPVTSLLQTDDKIFMTLNEVRRGEVSFHGGDPLVLREVPGGYYVVDGAHRVVEAILLGIDALPARVGYPYEIPRSLVPFVTELRKPDAWRFGNPRLWRFGREDARTSLAQMSALARL